MADPYQNFQIAQFRAADKIKNLKSRKQIFLYAFFTFLGGCLFLEATGMEDSPLAIIALLLTLACAYVACFRVDSQVSAIEMTLRLLESSYEENDTSRYESTFADLDRLITK